MTDKNAVSAAAVAPEASMDATPRGPVSTATISTVEPGRIILRLCKHWGHKFAVSYDDAQGRIELPMGLCLLRVEEGGLSARLEGTPEADMAHFEKVVADHAQRMARGETYVWDWRREPA